MHSNMRKRKKGGEEAAEAAEAVAVEEVHPQNTEEGAVEGPNLGNQVENPLPPYRRKKN